MGLIDTHTHLESFVRQGVLPAVLERAKAAGVEAMVTIGTSTEDWAPYRDLAKQHPGFVHYSAGLHPCAVDEHWAAQLSGLEAFWRQTSATGGAEANAARPVALGECGLDRFHLPKDDPAGAQRLFAWQREAFALQLSLAKQLGCPVVIHSRGAFQECLEIIDASGVEWTRVVFHCFTEGEAEMAELVKRGGYGSFTGIITYKNAMAVRAAMKAQGLGRLMIETDAPYLTPMPHRGKPNEPAFVRHTAEFAAKEIFGVSYEQLAKETTANARRFFGLIASLH